MRWGSPATTATSAGRPVRVQPHGHVRPGNLHQAPEHVRDQECLSAAHVVDTPGLAVHHQQAVGANYVAHVGHVAAHLEVPRGYPLKLALGGPDDLDGQVGHDETRPLPRASVVESPGPDHLQTAPQPGLQPDHFG